PMIEVGRMTSAEALNMELPFFPFSNPPPHPRLVGAIRIAELSLQIALFPRDDAGIDDPQQRHDKPDGPKASGRDAQPQVNKDHSEIERVPGSPIDAVDHERRRPQVRRNFRASSLN